MTMYPLQNSNEIWRVLASTRLRISEWRLHFLSHQTVRHYQRISAQQIFNLVPLARGSSAVIGRMLWSEHVPASHAERAELWRNVG